MTNFIMLCSADSSRLSREEFEKIADCLWQHATYWKEIGHGLGFTGHELDNIGSIPALFHTAPRSWLNKMLNSWYDWSPGDARGSKEYANRKSIKSAVSKVGFGRTASEL